MPRLGSAWSGIHELCLRPSPIVHLQHLNSIVDPYLTRLCEVG
jgi:hypothetical protein